MQRGSRRGVGLLVPRDSRQPIAGSRSRPSEAPAKRQRLFKDCLWHRQVVFVALSHSLRIRNYCTLVLKSGKEASYHDSECNSISRIDMIV